MLWGSPLPQAAGVQRPRQEPRCPASPGSVPRLWPCGMQDSRLPAGDPLQPQGLQGGLSGCCHTLSCQALPQVAGKEVASVLELAPPTPPTQSPALGFLSQGGALPQACLSWSPGPRSGRAGLPRGFPVGGGSGAVLGWGGGRGQEAEDTQTGETQASLRLRMTAAGGQRLGWTCGVVYGTGV